MAALPNRLIPLVALAAIVAGCARLPAAFPSSTASPGDGSGPPPTPVSSVATAVLWIDSPAAPYVEPTPAPLPTDAPPCRATDLATKSDAIGFGLGHSNLPIRFVNQSAAACLLAGYPTVSGVTADGKVVPLELVHGSYFGDPGPVTNIGPEGIAAVNVSGGDGCDAALTGTSRVYPTLRIGLPAGGSIDVASNGFDAICGVSVSQFGVPAADMVAAEPALSPLDASIDAPSTVTPGTLLEFTVTLRNPTATSVTFQTCPAYQEYVASGDGSRWVATVFNYYLNCDGTTIPPGGEQAFEMHLQLPADQPLGFAKFGWNLQGDAGPWTNAPLTVVAP